VNVVLRIEYDGTAYAGWQRQLNLPTVQQALEDAISEISGEKTTLYGAGRTDAGVHALGQTANFFHNGKVPPEKWYLALNHVLPPDICVLASGEAPEKFNARFDAVGKHYRYLVRDGKIASALWRGRCWQVYGPLDEKAMRTGIDALTGTHDFSSFMASGSVVIDTCRTLYKATLVRQNDTWVFDFYGNGFLYHMVRIMVGTIIDIGRGRINPEAMPSIMKDGDRRKAGITAPPQGLYMMEVFYPEALAESVPGNVLRA
jgi:tRNA pseudouridine38-40 synthase